MRRLTGTLFATLALCALALSIPTVCWAIPPTISGERISAPTTTSATLEAEVNPNGKATGYRFEYGLQDCATSSCTKVPVPDGILPPKVTGTGDLAKDSTKVTNLATTAGTFTVGQLIEGTGIPAATTIVAVSATELTLSKAATANGTGVALTATGPQHIEAALKDLTPGTTYHFRVIAKSSEGETKGPDRTFMTYQLPQVFEACSNDFLRLNNPAKARIDYSSANLPDCRAYEQASPIDKGAGDVSGTVPFVRSSTSGNGVVFISVSGVPGGKGSQDIPIYLASRASDWSTQGLLPPASFGQNARVLGWTPEFSDVFTRAIQLSDSFGAAMLITPPGVTPPGAEPTTVVPYLKGLAPFYAGASQGAQVVLFESKAAIPGVTGAIQGRSNVYLWEKASGQLSLAGVLNDGSAPPAGAFAGSYDWINGTNSASLAKGGADRDYYTQDQHAISKDGSAVYFTEAGTGQLYVRINPTEAQSATNPEGKCTQPAFACTIRVSESKRTVLDPAGDRPAAFQGASPDGTKALFTSSQMLTNDANTGPLQEPAAIEVASRADGTTGRKSCVPTHATGVAVDSEHIYWVNLDTGAIGRANLDCTDPDPVFLLPPELEPETGVLLPPQVMGVAVLGTTLYWTNGATRIEGEGEEPDKFYEGTIGRAKLNGDEPSSEVDPDFVSTAGNPHAVTANSEFVFWTNDPMPAGSGAGFIGRAKAADGEEVNAKLVETFLSPSEQPSISVDSAHIYWIETNTGANSRISRAKLDGGEYLINFIFLGAGLKGQGLAIVGDQIYWTTQANELVGRAKLNGDEPASEVQPDFIKNANNPGGLAADATTLYWATNGEAPPNPGNDLYLYDAKAKALEDVAPDSVSAKGIDVRGVLGASEDLSHVYFAANGVPDGVVGSPNGRGEEAKAGDCKDILGFKSLTGTCNLYHLLADLVRFISRLDVAGAERKTDAANWVATRTASKTFSGDFQKTARVTPDGQTLLFRSQRQLTDYDNKGVAQLYLYRAGDDEVSCVSCNPTSLPPRTSVAPSFGGISPSAVIPTPPAATLTHSLSTDGNKVFFETTEKLVGADTNGEDEEGKLKCPPVGAKLQQFPACADTYQWEAAGSGSCAPDLAVADGGCLYLLSTGEGSEPQMIADASADGSSVFFFSRSQLVGQDEDELMDVYVARTNGGLVAQNPPPPDPCLATDSCRGHDALPAVPPNPPKIVGPPNPKPPRTTRCPKGKRKVGGHCVPKKQHKGKKGRKGAKGKANSNRRQGR